MLAPSPPPPPRLPRTASSSSPGHLSCPGPHLPGWSPPPVAAPRGRTPAALPRAIRFVTPAELSPENPSRSQPPAPGGSDLRGFLPPRPARAHRTRLGVSQPHVHVRGGRACGCAPRQHALRGGGAQGRYASRWTPPSSAQECGGRREQELMGARRSYGELCLCLPGLRE